MLYLIIPVNNVLLTMYKLVMRLIQFHPVKMVTGKTEIVACLADRIANSVQVQLLVYNVRKVI
jgi:hypothetical protein